MKTIQITIDDELLAKLDGDAETQRDGRSAVLRRAAAEYLKRRRQESIAASYRRAYANERGLGPDFEGWENEGQWPKE